jgi:hypothetical protein
MQVHARVVVISASVTYVVVRASVFHFWVRGLDSRYGLMWKESVIALPKVVGFLQFSGESWQGGLGLYKHS